MTKDTNNDFNALLDDLTTIIDTYDNMTIKDGLSLSELLKRLTCTLFYLEKYRAEYHEKYNNIMYTWQSSVASGQIEANQKVPELYMMRRIMNAGYRCADALRSNISYIKKEN